MKVAFVTEHPNGGHVVVTDTIIEFHGKETPFFMYIDEGAQVKIVGKGFVAPENLYPGDEIDET